MDLVEFLTARLDEDEQAARAAKPGPWSADGGSVVATHPTDEVVDYTESAEHIARHDPARVLAEVAAKRRIVELHTTHPEPWVLTKSEVWFCSTCGDANADFTVWPCETLRVLALPYAGHPDYDEAWRP